jgi:hypothetical protein
VLIIALRSSTGAAAETVQLTLRAELTALMDYKLACECRDVALRAEQLRVSGKSRAETASILDAPEAIAEPVFVAFQYRPLSDVDEKPASRTFARAQVDITQLLSCRHFGS